MIENHQNPIWFFEHQAEDDLKPIFKHKDLLEMRTHCRAMLKIDKYGDKKYFKFWKDEVDYALVDKDEEVQFFYMYRILKMSTMTKTNVQFMNIFPERLHIYKRLEKLQSSLAKRYFEQ